MRQTTAQSDVGRNGNSYGQGGHLLPGLSSIPLLHHIFWLLLLAVHMVSNVWLCGGTCQQQVLLLAGTAAANAECCPYLIISVNALRVKEHLQQSSTSHADPTFL
jgi:hypothetical protein